MKGIIPRLVFILILRNVFYPDQSLRFNIYRTVAKKNTSAIKINNLSVNSRLPYLVISFFAMCICPPIDLNSSCVSLIMFEEETEKDINNGDKQTFSNV